MKTILIIMFWLSWPWIYLIAFLTFAYARTTKKTAPTFDALSNSFYSIMPFCAVLTVYLIVKAMLAVINIF